MQSKDINLDWQLWCRLCAKDDDLSNVNIVFKDEQKECGRKSLSQCLYDYFGLQMEEALPKMLCTQCFSYVTSLQNFSERVEKVQKMFQMLKSHSDGRNLNLYNIRERFGISEKDREDIFIPQTSLLEVHYFDSKPKILALGEKNENPLELNILKFEENNELALDTNNEPDISKTKNQKDNIQNYSNPTAAKSEVNDVFQCLSPLPLKVKFNKKKEMNSNSKQHIRSSNDGRKRAEGKNEAYLTKKTRKKRTKHEESKYTCSACSREFKHVQYFRQHVKRTHLVTSTLADWKCSHCPERVFVTRYQLDKHNKIHLPPELKRTVPCPYCEKKFSSNSIVQTHIKFIHNNDRSFICEECGVTMRTNAALKAHMLTHTDYAPFECDICKKGFKNQIRLKNHMEIHDPHKHICAECGLQLNSRATLNRHLLVHSDVMLHKCDYCGRAFKRAKALKNHLILHTGLKPYSCDFCERTFANGSNCRSHKKKAHPEELAALEASGGGKQYTKNIPKLEALKAVTKAADNLAPVVSKQSGRFAAEKKINHISTDSAANTTQRQSSDFEKPSDILQNKEDILNTSYDGKVQQKVILPLPDVENIYNQVLRPTSETKKPHQPSQQTIPEDMRDNLTSTTMSDVALHRRQFIIQNEQPSNELITSLHVPSISAMQSTPKTSASQLLKLPDVTIQPSKPLLGNQNHPQQYSTSSFLYLNEIELQKH